MQGHWLDRLEREHDNLRAALGWSIHEAGDAGLGQRLAGALYGLWAQRGYFSEGRGWLDAALARDDQGSPAACALVLTGAGVLAWMQGEYERAESLLDQSLALKRALDDRAGIAFSLNCLGSLAGDQGRCERAAALYQEAMALYRAQGDRHGIQLVLNNLGYVAYQQEEYERALTLHEDALALARERGDRWSIALGLFNLGRTIYQQGDHARARALLKESLGSSRGLGDPLLVAWILRGLAETATGPESGPEVLAWAARLLGAEMALRVALGAPLEPAERLPNEHMVAALQAKLGEEAFAIAWAEGRALPLEEAITLALEVGPTAAAQGQ